MTNEQLYEDMKQLLKGELSQLEQRLGDRIDTVERRLDAKIDTVEKRLIQRMDDGFGAASETAGNLIDQVDDHETRLTVLESA